MSFLNIGTNVVRLTCHCKNCIGLVDGKHSQGESWEQSYSGQHKKRIIVVMHYLWVEKI